MFKLPVADQLSSQTTNTHCPSVKVLFHLYVSTTHWMPCALAITQMIQPANRTLSRARAHTHNGVLTELNRTAHPPWTYTCCEKTAGTQSPAVFYGLDGAVGRVLLLKLNYGTIIGAAYLYFYLFALRFDYTFSDIGIYSADLVTDRRLIFFLSSLEDWTILMANQLIKFWFYQQTKIK